VCCALFGELSLHYFSAAQARRADANPFGCALYSGVHGPQIDIPAPPRHVMGVTDRISELRLLAANLANLCHRLLPGGSQT